MKPKISICFRFGYNFSAEDSMDMIRYLWWLDKTLPRAREMEFNDFQRVSLSTVSLASVKA
jgi:hypothetical protein